MTHSHRSGTGLSWRRGAVASQDTGKKTCPCHPAVVALCAVLVALLAAPALGRTITLSDLHADKMASTAAEAPRLSWAGYEPATAVFTTTLLDLTVNRSFFIRIPIDSIPAGQKITKAELVLPLNYHTPVDARFYVWRLLPEWSAGVCHQYRSALGEKLEWNVPGAKGNASDRASRPTAVVRVTKAGQVVVNVTQDVEMWYKGAAPNQGWLVSVEDEGTMVRFESPLWTGRGKWMLRITYEPE